MTILSYDEGHKNKTKQNWKSKMLTEAGSYQNSTLKGVEMPMNESDDDENDEKQREKAGNFQLHTVIVTGRSVRADIAGNALTVSAGRRWLDRRTTIRSLANSSGRGTSG